MEVVEECMLQRPEEKTTMMDGSDEYIASITDPNQELNKHVCARCRPIFHNLHKCSQLQDTQHRNQVSIKHYEDIHALEQSAQAECPTCFLFLDGLDQEKRNFIANLEDTYESFVQLYGMDPRNVSIRLVFERGGNVLAVSNIELMPAIDSEDESELSAVPDQTDSHQSWTQVRKWIDVCTNEHESCRINRDTAYLPTRLIEVGSNDEDIRLRSIEMVPPGAEYLTLSHCWGTLVVETLTISNLSTMLDRIPQEALNKTFRDAITITKRLGFRYLWIDSLCILQDSQQDWQQEAAKMAKVYSCSALNIAALDAPDGNTGCFFDNRKLTKAPFCKVAGFINRNDSKPSELYCSKPLYYDRVVQKSPLMKRAWVYQELFLSPRSVFFGKSELIWSCGLLEASETFPRRLIGYRKPLPMLYGFIHALKAKYFGKAWNDIVGAYSQGNLTFESDKLVALSGLAEMFSKECQLTYLAGLWREELENQLCWLVLTNHLPRPRDYLAPSWSWTSVHGTIITIWSGPITHLYITIEHASVQLRTPNPFGQVSDGVLILKAQIPPIQITFANVNRNTFLEAPSNWACPIYPDTEPNEFEGQIYLLLVSVQQETYISMKCLLLSALDPGEFRRVGYVTLSRKRTEADEAHRDKLALLPDIFLNSFTEEGKTIVIK